MKNNNKKINNKKLMKMKKLNLKYLVNKLFTGVNISRLDKPKDPPSPIPPIIPV